MTCLRVQEGGSIVRVDQPFIADYRIMWQEYWVSDRSKNNLRPTVSTTLFPRTGEAPLCLDVRMSGKNVGLHGNARQARQGGHGHTVLAMAEGTAPYDLRKTGPTLRSWRHTKLCTPSNCKRMLLFLSFKKNNNCIWTLNWQCVKCTIDRNC